MDEIVVIPTAGGEKKLLTQEAFSPTAFGCNTSEKLEPHVKVSGVIGGNGSTANPLIIKPGINNQVLATIAGVPTWTAVVGASSDSLVDTATNASSGAAIFEHTAADGTPTQFVEGFASVKTDSDCSDVGVGTGKMVRSISISATKVLEVDAAPEHDTLNESAIFANWDAKAVGGDLGDNVTYNVTLTNPSACRDMKGLILTRWEHRHSAVCNGLGSRIAIGQRLRVDGVTQADASNITLGGSTSGFRSFNTISIAAVGSVGEIEQSQNVSAFQEVTIPAGGSINVELHLEVVSSLTPANVSTSLVYAPMIGFIGSTGV